MMIKRIHIFGASGSGTTTLATALANTLDIPHYDTDDYFWIETDPPYQVIREIGDRQRRLRKDLIQNDSWVLSGSLCGWGDFTIPMFDLVIFLFLPSEIRLQRLKKREITRFGYDIEKPEHPRNKAYKAFMDWASSYDTGGIDMRSRSRHEEWMRTVPCPVLRIEGDHTLQDNITTILNVLLSNSPLDIRPGINGGSS